MRIYDMVNTAMAQQRLALSAAETAKASRRIAAGRLSPADDPTGFMVSASRRVDASTASLAAVAARQHLGVLAVADTTMSTVEAALIGLRDDLLAGRSDLAERSAAALDTISAAFGSARYGNVAVFAGEPGTAREYQPEVPAVEAAPATAATLRTGPLTLDAATLEALGTDGIEVTFTIDGDTVTVTVAAGASYADVDEFALAFVDAADAAGVAAAWDGTHLVVASSTPGASSTVGHSAGGELLGFEGAEFVAGTDAVEAQEGSPEVLARGPLPQQFRIVVDRPPLPAPAEIGDEEAGEGAGGDVAPDEDPDAAYVVPSWQMAVTVARAGIDTLGLEDFDPFAADALARIDAALGNVAAQRSSYGASMATLERVESLATSKAEILTAADERGFGVDVAAESYRLAAARAHTQVASAMAASVHRQGRSTMGALLGSIIDVDA